MTTTLLPVGTTTVQALFESNEDLHANSVGSIQETILPLAVTPTPTFSPTAGTYTNVQSVTLSDANPGAIIYYTTDGSAPTLASPQFVLPISVNATQTITAIALAQGDSLSSQTSALYTINLPPPGFSLSFTPATLEVPPGDSEFTTLFITPSNGFVSNVTFACSGLPVQVSCSFSPPTIGVTESAIYDTLLYVTNSAATANDRRSSTPVLPISLGTLCMCWLGWRRRWPRNRLALLAAALLGTVSLIACGGGGSKGGPGGGGTQPTQPATATITVTGTGNGITQSTTLKLTLN